MRNLSILSAVPRPLREGIVAQAVAFDVDEDRIFVVSETVEDANVSFGVWVFGQNVSPHGQKQPWRLG